MLFSIWPFLLFCIPPRPEHPFINFSSIMSDRYIHVAPCPLSLTRTRVFISISLNPWLISGLQLISAAVSCCQLGSSVSTVPPSPPLSSLSFVLHKHSVPIALSPSPLLLSLPLLFPTGVCLHFSVNLPENALAVMKAEGRGNPPGFH